MSAQQASVVFYDQRFTRWFWSFPENPPLTTSFPSSTVMFVHRRMPNKSGLGPFFALKARRINVAVQDIKTNPSFGKHCFGNSLVTLCSLLTKTRTVNVNQQHLFYCYPFTFVNKINSDLPMATIMHFCLNNIVYYFAFFHRFGTLIGTNLNADLKFA